MKSMEKGLVNILIPAFNLADYISRLLQSILEQTYHKIKIYVINDGSSDNTKEIVTSYIEKFKRNGITLELINQDNAGQASVINKGLKFVDGEYLVWPDCDDWYASPYAIEKLVSALENSSDEVGVSRCAYKRIDEESGRCIEISHPCDTEKPTNIFKSAVYGLPGFWLEPGGWMIKTKFLDKFIPGREIYTSRLTGQNSQILWPYLFYTKCIAIDEPLYCYLVRKNSHSHGLSKNYDKRIQQQIEYGKTFDAVIDGINGMSSQEKSDYHVFIGERVNSQKLALAKKYKKSKDIRRFFYYAFHSHKYYSLNTRDYFIYALSYCPILLDLKEYLFDKTKRIFSYVINNKALSIIFSLLIIFFVCISYLLLAPKVAKKWYELTYRPSSYTNANDLEERILSGVKILLNEEYTSDETIMYYKTVNEHISRTLNKKDVRVYDYGEYGYLLYFTYLYATEKRDSALLDVVKRKFDEGIINNQPLSVKRNDQIAYGCLATEYAKQYGKNSKYMSYCLALLNRLDSMSRADGIVLYHENDLRQHVDGIGLVCPFLIHFAKCFGNERAKALARNMCEDFITYGVDYSNGLPAQAYHTKTKIKDLRSNWGRGTSWFLLGIMDLDSLSFNSKRLVLKTDSTLLTLAPLYPQYLGEPEDTIPDMSSTIPITYYLTKRNIIHIRKEDFARLINPYVDNMGIVRYNSPSISRPEEKPNAYQSHFLTQGIALYLMGILK